MTLPVLFLRSPLDRVYKRDDHGRFGSGSGGVRSELADAKTAEAVGAAAAAEAKRITGKDIPFDFHGAEPQLAREYSEGVLRGLERFPTAPLGAVRTTEFPAEAHDEFTWAHTLHAGNTASGKYEIEFNTRGEVAERANEILRMKQARGSFAFGDVQGMALHEFGHVLHEHYNTSAEADRLQRAYVDKHVPEPAPAPGKRRLGVGPRKPGQLTEEQTSEHRQNRKAFALREISFYSQSNSHELAAEAFADVMTKGEHASPLSHQIMDALNAKIAAEPRAITYLLPSGRVYKRDDHGRFGSGGGGGTVRKALADAKTTEAVNQAAATEAKRITGRDIEFSMSGDTKIAAEHAEGILRGLEAYPSAPLNRVGTNANAFTRHENAWAMTTHGENIDFNPSHTANSDAYRAELQKAQTDGHLVVGSPTGVALHEFGHVLFHRGAGGFAGQVVAEDAAAKAGQGTSEFVTKNISRYATSSGYEMGAEAFADVMHNNSRASDLSRAVVDIETRAAGVQAVTWLSPAGRVYKRDERGRFGSGGTGGTVRKALADAKTKDELTAAAEAAAARVTGRPEGDIRFFARHSDLEVAKQHFEGVLQGLERFPHAPLSTVSDFDPDNPGAVHYGADVSSTMAYSGMGYEKGSINFNAQYSAHPDKYQKVLDQSAEDAFTTSSVRTPHLVAATMQGVALHEFGHVLTQQQHPLVGGGSGPPKVPAKKIAAELNPGGKTTADFIRGEISEYATTNQHELSAEAFADVVHNGSSASHVSRAIYNEIAALYPQDAQAITYLSPLDAGRVYKRDKRGRFGSGDGGGEGETAPVEEPKTGVDALPMMKKAPTVSAAAKGTNPNFGSQDPNTAVTYRAAGKAGKNWDPSMGPPPYGAYTENCTNCVHAFEMRMRGFDVEAAPLHVLDKHGYAAGRTYKEVDDQIASSWTLPDGKPHGRSFAGQKWRSFEQIDSEIKAWPEGGRGFVTVGKHVFNVMKAGGKAKYVEAQFDASPTRVVTAQYRKKYRSYPTSSGERQEAKLVRLDDLKPADGILESVAAKS